jgi:hypothetical protein
VQPPPAPAKSRGAGRREALGAAVQ